MSSRTRGIGFLNSALTLCLLFAGSRAAIATPKSFDIGASDAAHSLIDFGRQASVQIVFASEKVKGFTTNAVHGSYEPIQAIRLLLSGTGLSVSEKESGVLVVEPTKEKRASSGVGRESTTSDRDVALAEAAHPQAFNESPAGKAPDAVPQADTDKISEIVVTALKRSETLQTAPLAISAVSGNTLEEMGIHSSQDLASIAPGLVITENPLGGARITIRNIRSPGEATVGLYYDETPLISGPGVENDSGSSAPAVSLFDVERVEVLRGPQGTLYGSGSEAGTVRLIFEKPKLGVTEGVVDVQGTGINAGGAGGQGQFMVNVPLIDNLLAVRATGFYSYVGGYIDNPDLHLSDVNTQRTEGGRLLVRYQPLDALTIDAMAVLQNKSGWVNDWSLNAGPYVENYATRQPMTDNLRLYSGTLKWNVGFADLTVVGSHSERDLAYQYDVAYFTYVAGLFPAGSPVQQLALSQNPASAYAPQSTTVSTEEARLSSTSGGPFQWTVGVFHSERISDISSNVYGADASGDIVGSEDYYSRYIDDDLKETAGFGELTYSITPQWDVTWGGRKYDYDRSTGGAVTVGNVLLGSLASPASTAQTSDSGWLFKYNTSYRFTSEIMGYAQASQGYRPGGVNQVVGLPASLGPYAPDSLWDYEAGLKTAWFDRTLTVDADVFQINWSNIQVEGETLAQTNGATFAFISNAGNARVRGVEFDTNYLPLPGLQLHLSGSYMRSILTTDQVSAVVVSPGQKGDDIPYAPTMTLQAGPQYSWTLVDGWKGMARMDVDYNSESWTQFDHNNAFQDRLPRYATVNLRTGASQAGNGWSAYLFANNLLNKLGLVNKNQTVLYGGTDAVRAISITPRTIGAEVSKRF